MEYLSGIGTLSAAKMLVMSNIFRAGQPPPKQYATRSTGSASSLNIDKTKSDPKKPKKYLSRSNSESLKFTITLRQSMKKTIKSNSSDTNILNSDSEIVKTKVNIVEPRRDRDSDKYVISSAKGLLETDLDVLFSDCENANKVILLESNHVELIKPDHINVQENNLTSANGYNRDSVDSGTTDEDDDETTDSDYLDEVIQEQSRCLGARRFGYMLRRVISRNGE